MTTRLRFAAALDLCMRLLLALVALGVISMIVGSSNATGLSEPQRQSELEQPNHGSQ